MPRKLLVFAAIAVVGSMLVLWLVTRNRDAEQSSRGDEPRVITHADGEQDLRPNRPRLDEQPTAPLTTPEGETRPDISNSNMPRASDDGRAPAATVTPTEKGTAVAQKPHKEYTLPDGTRVRDFRDPAQQQDLVLPPTTRAPGGRKIKPDLTSRYTEQILAHMRACGKAVPKSALGTKPRLEGQIVIAIKQQQGSVTSAVFNLTNLNDPASAQTAKQCIEEKALTVKVPATDEADLDAYSINLSFAFP